MFHSQLRSLTHWTAPVVGALLISGAGVAWQTDAQEKPEVSEKSVAPQTGTTPESPSPGQTGRRQPRGRLPAYFAAVVSQKQRGQIYGIQAQYNEKVVELRMQIDQLLAQRDKEVDAVLTPEQLQEVTKKREAAAARRQSRRPSPDDAGKEP